MLQRSRGQNERGRKLWLRRLVVTCVTVAILLGLCILAGCTHFIRQDGTPYYVEGRHQLDPPNGELSAGTGVWIIGEDDTYRRIWTLDGVIAYVWEGDLVTRTEWKQIEEEQKLQDQQRERERKRQEELAEHERQPLGIPAGSDAENLPWKYRDRQHTKN